MLVLLALACLLVAFKGGLCKTSSLEPRPLPCSALVAPLAANQNLESKLVLFSCGGAPVGKKLENAPT